MAARDGVQSRKRSTSPLLINIPKKTETRRARSRSRSSLNSQLVRRVDQIPAFHNTFEYLASTYNVIKDSSPLMKENLQRTEDIWYWFKEKAEDFVAATQMTGPLKSIDAAAANGLDQLEKTRVWVKSQYEETQKEWFNRLKDLSSEVRRFGDNASYSMLESMQTLLDYLEELFEKVMLPPSDETAKYCQNVGLFPILYRLLDMTYRIQAGIWMKILKDIRNLQSMAMTQFDPFTLWHRSQIIWQEIFAPVGKKLTFMQNSKLTEIDRQIIVSGRVLFAAWQRMADIIKAGPESMLEAGKGYLEFIRNFMEQFFKDPKQSLSGFKLM